MTNYQKVSPRLVKLAYPVMVPWKMKSPTAEKYRIYTKMVIRTTRESLKSFARVLRFSLMVLKKTTTTKGLIKLLMYGYVKLTVENTRSVMQISTMTWNPQIRAFSVLEVAFQDILKNLNTPSTNRQKISVQ